MSTVKYHILPENGPNVIDEFVSSFWNVPHLVGLTNSIKKFDESNWIANDFDQTLKSILAVELNNISLGISKPASENDWMIFLS